MEEVKMLAPCAGAGAGVNGLSLPKLRRKRSDSVATDAPVASKLRLDDSSACSRPPSPTVAPSTGSVASAHPPAQVASGFDVNILRDAITGQLDLEVLLKHNELRLIDQEIAKCQVALEQLRRCAEIPYPGSVVTGPSADVSAGTGASLPAPGNGPAAVSPAPWGVTDGPYSRHYARWLLPDPRFDGGETESAVPAGTGPPQVEGRSTRGNPLDFSTLAGKTTRPSRNSTSSKMQSISNGLPPPPPKEKTGPMLIRRKSDQVLVKLVCLDCQRDNFSSTQGFINHCRIAHNRNFASHDAAAMASGEPVEVDESGAVVGGRTESTSTPTVSTTPGYVHPLIRSAQLPTPDKESVTPRKVAPVNPAAPVTTPASLPRAHDPRRQSEPVKPAMNSSFLASPATPHLSALMRERGLGLDLNKLVQEAKTPVDLSGLSDDESGDESRQSSAEARQKSTQQGVGAARQPMRTPAAQAASQRPEGQKGLERATHGPQSLQDVSPSRPQSSQPSCLTELSLTGPSGTPTTDAPREGDGVDHPSHLSPNTVESNQAPSLVSDYDDDYGAGSESDSPVPSEADEDDDEEFRHIQVQDDERTATPATTATTDPKSAPPNPAPQAAPPLSKPVKQSRSDNLSMLPSFNDRGRDDQRDNLVQRQDDNSNPYANPYVRPNPNPNNPDGRNPSSP